MYVHIAVVPDNTCSSSNELEVILMCASSDSRSMVIFVTDFGPDNL